LAQNKKKIEMNSIVMVVNSKSCIA